MQLSDPIAKAGVLVEALPYIADFRGEIIVVKLGGSVQEDLAALRSTLTDVAFMRVVGMRPIVVHGGGKAITRALKEAGVETRFEAGFSRRASRPASASPTRRRSASSRT